MGVPLEPFVDKAPRAQVQALLAAADSAPLGGGRAGAARNACSFVTLEQWCVQTLQTTRGGSRGLLWCGLICCGVV